MINLPKSTFILLVVSVCIQIQAFSQMHFGYQTGLNVSDVTLPYNNDNPYNISFNTGFLAKYEFSKKYFLSFKCLLSQKGFSDLYIPDGTTFINLYYLSFPILFEYKTPNGIYFQSGPEFNYLITANEKNDGLKRSVTDHYKKFDIAIAASLGYNISKRMSFELSYLYGITSINSSLPVESIHNRTAQLNLLYWFR